jgi:uncharacterized Zn-finger protein
VSESRLAIVAMADSDRFLCPFCHRAAVGAFDHCGGSFLHRDHPSNVRPVFVPMGEDAEAITAAARETYR